MKQQIFNCFFLFVIIIEIVLRRLLAAKEKERTMKNSTITDPRTGMQISVPVDKLGQKPIRRTPEQEAAAREKFHKAFLKLADRIYGTEEK